MAFKRIEHPLNWGDTELSYLITVGLNATNLWRAMGYKGNRPSASFMSKIYKLGYVAPERKG
jgi:hypothetical protein